MRLSTASQRADQSRRRPACASWMCWLSGNLTMGLVQQERQKKRLRSSRGGPVPAAHRCDQHVGRESEDAQSRANAPKPTIRCEPAVRASTSPSLLEPGLARRLPSSAAPLFTTLSRPSSPSSAIGPPAASPLLLLPPFCLLSMGEMAVSLGERGASSWPWPYSSDVGVGSAEPEASESAISSSRCPWGLCSTSESIHPSQFARVGSPSHQKGAKS